MSFEISLRGRPILVDAKFEENLGIYGKEFWLLIDCNAYEPATFDFLQRTYFPGAYFLDIGAATGCMSLYAAQLGYCVIALEPQRSVFEALRRNVELNTALQGDIELIHALVVNSESKESDEISDFFTSGASGPLEGLSSSVRRISMRELLSSVNSEAKTVIKVDIEGAEFNLLRDVGLLSELKARNSVMYLSLHPGFLSPLQGNSKLARLVWLIKATQEVVDLYFRLRRYSCIMNSEGSSQMNLVSILLQLQGDSRDFQINFK